MNRSYRYLSYILFLPLALGVVSPCFALDLTADFLFIASLFVLGGDFWEKFQALFSYDR